MPNTAPHPLLAREGWWHVALTLIAATGVTLWIGWLWAIPLWLLCLFVIQFFRDPQRVSPKVPGQVLSPADGKVVYVGSTKDPYLNRQALKISVFMNVFNVHSNRSPVRGVVQKVWYFPGRFINAELDKASEQNERNAIWINDSEGHGVIVLVQVAGLIARRILCYVKEGDPLDWGQRYGFIRFGSRLDIYLPETFTAHVRIGDKVTAGVDIVGTRGQ